MGSVSIGGGRISSPMTCLCSEFAGRCYRISLMGESNISTAGIPVFRVQLSTGCRMIPRGCTVRYCPTRGLVRLGKRKGLGKRLGRVTSGLGSRSGPILVVIGFGR